MPGINSVIDVMFRKWLVNNHVPLDKVKVVEGPLPQLPDMLKSASVDYVAIVDPLRTRIVATRDRRYRGRVFRRGQSRCAGQRLASER